MTFDEWFLREGFSLEHRGVLLAAWEAGQKSAYDLQHASFTAPDLSFATLRATNVKRCEASFFGLSAWSPMEWGAAIAEETGEFCGVMKKIARAKLMNLPTTLTLEDAAHELADIVTYVDLAAAAIGVDLGEAVRRKFNIVSERVGSKERL